MDRRDSSSIFLSRSLQNARRKDFSAVDKGRWTRSEIEIVVHGYDEQLEIEKWLRKDESGR